MAPDLPDKLLGIDIDGDDRAQQRSDESDDEEDLVRLVLFTVGEHRLAVPVDEVRTTTDLPDELTSVPRTPPAVEGVTDLRGEITAVIDPSVHFPTDEHGAGAGGEQLLVFDRGADDQSAAIRVDEVLDVESVPERNLLEADDVASRDFETDLLEHPLVSVLAEQERRPTQRIGETVVSPTGGAAAADSVGESDAASADATDAAPQDEPVVVELTPVVDVDTLLLAAGPRS
ncbi:chemotaxis protein CheW [Halopiger xanaduensis]|uniref:CheW protein n=1 Tax=Halopiger xanaduensis (strain DSM 18323 / JCM 14033 / SH-6) TaxID=797210 RepID=F8DC57_HALXS|nr:chemotaxis protein CheW [Halopiger xanaduensis]AEH37170.1 CheW protein [Halopiger xanaduensis SH-6]